MKKQVKQPTTLEEQLRHLSERGMVIDEDLALRWLSNVSYYRLSGYWYSYRVLLEGTDPKKPVRSDKFESGTSFAEVAALYEFDRKLRTLVHDGIERIEIALRARIGEWVVSHGASEYRNAALFRPEFNHEEWLDKVNKRIERARKNNPAIKHYCEHYVDYPFWVVAEVIDFSDISKLFNALPISAQHSISRSFIKVNTDELTSKQKNIYYQQEPLARWCQQLTVVRNTCAHHSRLFNRHFTPASTNAFRTNPLLASLPEGESYKLYGTLLIMAFMLRKISPGTTWINKITMLIRNGFIPLSLRSVAEMGFPDKWEDNFSSLQDHSSSFDKSCESDAF